MFRVITSDCVDIGVPRFTSPFLLSLLSDQPSNNPVVISVPFPALTILSLLQGKRTEDVIQLGILLGLEQQPKYLNRKIPASDDLPRKPAKIMSDTFSVPYNYRKELTPSSSLNDTLPVIPQIASNDTPCLSTNFATLHLSNEDMDDTLPLEKNPICKEAFAKGIDEAFIKEGTDDDTEEFIVTTTNLKSMIKKSSSTDAFKEDSSMDSQSVIPVHMASTPTKTPVTIHYETALCSLLIEDCEDSEDIDVTLVNSNKIKVVFVSDKSVPKIRNAKRMKKSSKKLVK